MITILLALALAHQAGVPLSPAPPRPTAMMRVSGGTPDRCRASVTPTGDPDASGQVDLQRLGRTSGGDVALYRLLERRIDGCPSPIIVNHRVPGSNALGRVIGMPTPVAPRP